MTSNRLTSALAASVLVAASLLASAAQAYTLEEFQFDSPIQERQFRELTGKLRCLVCQNESLAASQSDLAQDLRKEVYGMMKACLLYTSPSPRDATLSRMPSSS